MIAVCSILIWVSGKLKNQTHDLKKNFVFCFSNLIFDMTAQPNFLARCVFCFVSANGKEATYETQLVFFFKIFKSCLWFNSKTCDSFLHFFTWYCYPFVFRCEYCACSRVSLLKFSWSNKTDQSVQSESSFSSICFKSLKVQNGQDNLQDANK